MHLVADEISNPIISNENHACTPNGSGFTLGSTGMDVLEEFNMNFQERLKYCLKICNCASLSDDKLKLLRLMSIA